MLNPFNASRVRKPSRCRRRQGQSPTRRCAEFVGPAVRCSGERVGTPPASASAVYLPIRMLEDRKGIRLPAHLLLVKNQSRAIRVSRYEPTPYPLRSFCHHEEPRDGNPICRGRPVRSSTIPSRVLLLFRMLSGCSGVELSHMLHI